MKTLESFFSKKKRKENECTLARPDKTSPNPGLSLTQQETWPDGQKIGHRLGSCTALKLNFSFSCLLFIKQTQDKTNIDLL